MTIADAIKTGDEMDIFEKAKIYMRYFVNTVAHNYTSSYCIRFDERYKIRTFESFCSRDNIEERNAGECWRERGFASEKYIVLTPESLYQYIYLQIK